MHDLTNRKIPAGKFSRPMLEAVHRTPPKGMLPEHWAGLKISDKLRIVVQDWLKTNGCDFQDPEYRQGRPPKAKKEHASRKRA
jgi:hypothetical protein